MQTNSPRHNPSKRGLRPPPNLAAWRCSGLTDATPRRPTPAEAGGQWRSSAVTTSPPKNRASQHGLPAGSTCRPAKAPTTTPPNSSVSRVAALSCQQSIPAIRLTPESNGDLEVRTKNNHSALSAAAPEHPLPTPHELDFREPTTRKTPSKERVAAHPHSKREEPKQQVPDNHKQLQAGSDIGDWRRSDG